MDTTRFLNFMDHSHSVYHAAAAVEKELKDAGYTRLEEKDEWQLAPGGRYYLVRGAATVIAFRIPEESPCGFLISAAHVDRPCLKVKENGELKSAAYNRLKVEGYGGMLLSPWADRPLSLAGRVMVQTEQGARTCLVDIDRDLMMIPNVAIHMNRQANDGYKWTIGGDMQPLLGSAGTAGMLQKLLEEEAGGELLGQDLYLYVRDKARVWGLNGEYVSAQGLDDLQCVWSSLQGFLQAGPSRDVTVFCALNSEEIGSRTREGADSSVLSDTLARIAAAAGAELLLLLAQSFLVSLDNAHAMHPNHPELADPENAPLPGGGPVLKFNANQNYSTDGLAAAVFRTTCRKAQVPVQNYYNKPDIRGGGTLGHVSISHVSVPTADIGMAQFAMHSCYETASVSDIDAVIRAMAAYFGSTLQLSEEGFSLN